MDTIVVVIGWIIAILPNFGTIKTKRHRREDLIESYFKYLEAEHETQGKNLRIEHKFYLATSSYANIHIIKKLLLHHRRVYIINNFSLVSKHYKVVGKNALINKRYPIHLAMYSLFIIALYALSLLCLNFSDGPNSAEKVLYNAESPQINDISLSYILSIIASILSAILINITQKRINILDIFVGAATKETYKKYWNYPINPLCYPYFGTLEILKFLRASLETIWLKTKEFTRYLLGLINS